MIINRYTPLDNLPELLRVSEAATWMDCSEGTIYEMAATGALASVRLGRLLRIPREGLVKLVAERKTA